MARAGKVAVHRITSAGAPEPADLASRERAYLIMMGIRFIAIIVAVIVPGFWRWVAIAAGVLLPYIAVVLVNATKTRGTQADPAFWADQKLALTTKPEPQTWQTGPSEFTNPKRRQTSGESDERPGRQNS